MLYSTYNNNNRWDSLSLLWNLSILSLQSYLTWRKKNCMIYLYCENQETLIRKHNRPLIRRIVRRIIRRQQIMGFSQIVLLSPPTFLSIRYLFSNCSCKTSSFSLFLCCYLILLYKPINDLFLSIPNEMIIILKHHCLQLPL